MKIRTGTFAEVFALHNRIPELEPIAKVGYFSDRIGNRQYLLLVAEIADAVVGYKLGYWLDNQCFYSWLGGVHPSYRKQGIAKALMLEQERRIGSTSAKEIRVKSMNQYRAMLLLLISQGYDIVGVELNVHGRKKIHFSKKFNE